MPRGGRIMDVDFGDLTPRLQDAYLFARNMGEIELDPEAGELWDRAYLGELSDAKPGLLGAMTARSEPQALRLAGIYALMDCSAVVKLWHLESALALWQYCEDSASYIFGGRMGDPNGDQTLRAIKSSENGLLKSQINNLFHGHLSSDQLDILLESLEEKKLIRRVVEKTAGRTRERYLYCGKS